MCGKDSKGKRVSNSCLPPKRGTLSANSSYLFISVLQDAILLTTLMSGFPIKVDMVEKKGRGVVATKQLSKGNVVFTDSPFVSYVLFENEVCTFVALD